MTESPHPNRPDRRSTPPAGGGVSRALHVLLVGTVCYFLLAFVVSVGFALDQAAGQDLRTFFILLIVPALHLGIATATAALNHVIGARRPWIGVAGGLAAWGVLMAARFGPQSFAEPWSSRTPLAAAIAPFAIVVGITAVLHWLRARSIPGPWGKLWSLCLTAAVLSVAPLCLMPPPFVLRANEFGLVSMPPDEVVTADFPNTWGMERYPVCTFAHNALGYRDVAPSRERGTRTRVLMVGDSFMWGDGIPSNTETLPGQTRAALERAAPGRYEVMAAAYPGTGVYGYHRAVTALQPHFRPDFVVIGFLGGADYQAYGSQVRLDRLPGSACVVNLLVNLGVQQQFHAADISHQGMFPARSGARWASGLLQELRRHADDNGYHLLLVDYDMAGRTANFDAAGLEFLPLPDGWKLRSADRRLWYVEREHPAPELNRRLGGRVADTILARDRDPLLRDGATRGEQSKLDRTAP